MTSEFLTRRPGGLHFKFQLAYDKTHHPSLQDLLVTNGRKCDGSAPDNYTFVIKLPAPNAMDIATSRKVARWLMTSRCTCAVTESGS